jgi:dTDP-glucose 4,6-dehydratase
MRILVTGGRGTIGTVLTPYLRRTGHDVWTCDLAHYHHARHLRCDVAEYRQLKSVFDEHAFDLVYHLAAEYGRWNGEDYFEQLWRTNVIGTKNVIRLQEQIGFRMIFASTSEVYGDSAEVMNEDLMNRSEIRQLNDYAISKWVGEMQIMNSAAMYGTESVRVRLFNTYGPGEYFTPYRSAVCRFIYCAINDIPYTVYLGHRRTSIYINDTVSTLAALTDSFVPGEVYNIGGNESHTMREVSDRILHYLGKDDSLVTYAEAEPFTTREKRLDTTKAEQALGHDPMVDLDEGIARTITWMQRVYGDGEEADPCLYTGEQDEYSCCCSTS